MQSSATKPVVIGLSKKRLTNNRGKKKNNYNKNNKSTIINNSKYQNQPKNNQEAVKVSSSSSSSSFRRRSRRRHHHQQRKSNNINNNNIVIVSFSNLIIENEILRNIIFSFCDLISFVQLCGTCKRLSNFFYSGDQWDRYESMIPKSSRWCYYNYNDDDDDDDDDDGYHDDHCEVTTETSTTTTTIRGNVGRPKQRNKTIINAIKTKMRVLRYVRASRFATKLQPRVPYHSTNTTNHNSTTTDHYFNNNTFNAVGCFNKRKYSSYGYFVRLFPLPHCVSDFSSSDLMATKEKFMKVDHPLLLSSSSQNQEDNDEILWQGFLNVNKFTEWQHNGKTIEIQTQSEFDLMMDVPNLISEHTRLRRWSPLTNLANNIGIIVIAIQKPMMMTSTDHHHHHRDRMSLVYASTQTAPTCMVFSKMNFELSNTYLHHHHHHHRRRHATDRSSSSEEESPPQTQTPTPVVATAPRPTSGFVGTTTMRRVSMIANGSTTTKMMTSGDNNNQISLTFKLDEGDANRIGFIGNPYLVDLHKNEDGKNNGNDDNDNEKRKNNEQKPVRQPPPPPPMQRRSDLLLRRRLRIPPHKVADLRKEGPIVGKTDDGSSYLEGRFEKMHFLTHRNEV